MPPPLIIYWLAMLALNIAANIASGFYIRLRAPQPGGVWSRWDRANEDAELGFKFNITIYIVTAVAIAAPLVWLAWAALTH